VTWTSERKKNEVCGLISSSAWPPVVFDGAMAMPFDPRGSGGTLSTASARRGPGFSP
jgi:hypothetical protein